MSNNFVIVCTGGFWQTNKGTNVYVRSTNENFGILLPPDFDIQTLYERVKKKTQIFQSKFTLTLQHPDLGYVMNIVDEEDVLHFRNIMLESHQPVHLFVVVGTEVVPELVVEDVPENIPSRSFREKSEKGKGRSGRENSEKGKEKMMERNVSEHDDKFEDENVQNFVVDNGEESSEEEELRMNEEEQQRLIEYGRLADNGSSEDENPDEGWSEDEFTHGKKATDYFYGMPPIPDCPEPVLEPGPFHSLGPDDDMVVHQTYDSKKDLIFALCLKATREGFSFVTKKSSKNRFQANCKEKDCNWRLYAKSLLDNGLFEIRKFNDIHNCSRLQIHPNHKHANSQVLGTIMYKIMGNTKSKYWKPNEISRDLGALLKITISYKQAWLAKQYAMRMMQGSDEECFGKLPIYFHNLKLHNPGTVTYIETDSEDRFECCFFAIGAAVSLFRK